MLRVVLLSAFLGLAVLYYFFFGPGPTASEMFGEIPFWKPRGWALRWLPAKPLADMARAGFPAAALPIALFLVPALALFAGTIALFRHPLVRALLFAVAMTMCGFVFYGYMAEGVWRFFDWRFPLVVSSLGLLTGGILFMPSLLRGALARSGVAALMLLGVTFAVIFALSTEITGTDPSLPFNVSPWPILTLVGLLLVGYALSVLHASSGIAAWLAQRIGGVGGFTLGVVCALAAALGLGWLAFQEPGMRFAVGALAVVYAAALIWLRTSRDPEAVPNAAARIAAGLFLFASIFVANGAASSFQSHARDATALRLLVALEAYKRDHQAYPETLRALVPSYLPGVPHPRIGLLRHGEDAFTYTGFGDSYALEFASVLWVQCQYSPPFEYTPEELEEMEVEGELEAEAESWVGADADVAAGERPNADELATRAMLAEHGLNGSWSCAETPPKLW